MIWEIIQDHLYPQEPLVGLKKMDWKALKHIFFWDWSGLTAVWKQVWTLKPAGVLLWSKVGCGSRWRGPAERINLFVLRRTALGLSELDILIKDSPERSVGAVAF